MQLYSQSPCLPPSLCAAGQPARHSTTPPPPPPAAHTGPPGRAHTRPPRRGGRAAPPGPRGPRGAPWPRTETRSTRRTASGPGSTTSPAPPSATSSCAPPGRGAGPGRPRVVDKSCSECVLEQSFRAWQEQEARFASLLGAAMSGASACGAVVQTCD